MLIFSHSLNLPPQKQVIYVIFVFGNEKKERSRKRAADDTRVYGTDWVEEMVRNAIESTNGVGFIYKISRGFLLYGSSEGFQRN